jgi:hypothetical protein
MAKFWINGGGRSLFHNRILFCKSHFRQPFNQLNLTVMKKFHVYLFLLAVLAFSCSKDRLMDDNYGPDIPGLKMLKATAGAVINLAPATDGDDTEELLAAFEEAKAAGPGSTVKLAAGEFHIGFIVVNEFYGSFVGAGMGKTVIIPLDGLDPTDLYSQNLAPELLKFIRGNVKITNMSFLNLEGEPVPGDDLWGFLGLHDYAHNELPDLPDNHKITALLDHVEFASNPGPSGWSQWAIQTAIGCGPDFVWDYNLPNSFADITITNCTMRDFFLAFTNLGIEEGEFLFSNNRPVRTDMGIWLVDNIGGKSLICGNEFLYGQAVVITDAAYMVNEFKPSDGCQYEISGNVFHAKDSWGPVTIADDRKAIGIIDNKNPVLVQIKNNHFDLQGSTLVGIWNWITDNSIIRNNKFTGNVNIGIYVDPRTTNSLMLGNNFSGLTATKTSELEWLGLPYDCTGYNILLVGNNNTVVGGGNNSTTVLNLGENNLITGAKFVNEGEKNLGQTISENYRIWKENMVNMRKK